MNKINAEVLRADLASLYADLSKHSAYQSIPEFVANAINYQVEINENWRGDRVRLEYILSRLPHDSGRWGDFGANTGYFSLSLAHANPKLQVLAIEANPNHADFIRRVSAAFELPNLEIIGRPVAINDLFSLPRLDVLLHLNVLHHAGADFDTGLVTGTGDFLPYAHAYLQRLRACARTLVFQIGTNLWGDKARPLIDYREDAAKLELLSALLTDSGWRIDEVAYARLGDDGRIQYAPLPNIDSQWGATADLADALAGFHLPSHLGEFYRRPLFFASQHEHSAQLGDEPENAWTAPSHGLG